VKLDVDTLVTVPTVPPAAGPDRAFDPPPPAARRGKAPAVAPAVAVVVPVLAAAELLPEVASTIP
jgi:hypothetical protein